MVYRIWLLTNIRHILEQPVKQGTLGELKVKHRGKLN